AMLAYLRDGERRAFDLGNRGPIRFTPDGQVHPEILEAYWRCGFYVFEGVLDADELADIERGGGGAVGVRRAGSSDVGGGYDGPNDVVVGIFDRGH
ncbi:MAG TPA: hypothetical protein VFG00_02935, partial [Acidothermaceae bacterium]|nr:hypothetical protein [Acidothermaceae bacterium]